MPGAGVKVAVDIGTIGANIDDDFEFFPGEYPGEVVRYIAAVGFAGPAQRLPGDVRFFIGGFNFVFFRAGIGSSVD